MPALDLLFSIPPMNNSIIKFRNIFQGVIAKYKTAVKTRLRWTHCFIEGVGGPKLML